MGVCLTKFVKHHRFADTKFRSQHLKSENPCLTNTAYSLFPYVFCQTTRKVLGYAHDHFTPLRCLTFFACQFCPTFFACDCRRVFPPHSGSAAVVGRSPPPRTACRAVLQVVQPATCSRVARLRRALAAPRGAAVRGRLAQRGGFSFLR